MARRLALLIVLIAALAVPSYAAAHPDARSKSPGSIVFVDGNGRLQVVAPTAGAEKRTLSVDPVQGGSADVSPDGTKVLYASNSGGSIYTAPIDDSAAPTKVAQGLEKFETSPVWRPDGKAFAYLRRTAGTSEIVVRALDPADAGQNTEIELPAVSGRISWSPDGTELVASWNKDGGFFQREIGIVDVASGTVSALSQSRSDNDRLSEDDPDWSPDGSRIVFTQSEGLLSGEVASRVVIASATTGEIRSYLRYGFDGVDYRGPSWSPAGDAVAYYARSSRTGEGTPGHDLIIHRTDGTDGSGTEPIVLSRTYAPDAPVLGGRIEWGQASAKPSNVGRIFFRSDNQLVSMPAGGGARKVVRAEGGAEPAVSADGTRVAFGTSQGIYTMTAGGRDVRKLTSGNDSYPAFTPDGSALVFVRVGRYEVWTVNADGTGERRLTDTGGYDRDYDPVVTPDGEYLVFARNSSNANITRIRFKALSGGPGDQDFYAYVNGRQPSFSPDGKQMAYTTVVGSLAQVAAIDVDPETLAFGTPRVLTSRPKSSRDPSFSPDGTSVAYEYEDSLNAHSIRAVRADGTGDTQLTGAAYDVEPFWAFSPAPPKVTVADAAVDEGTGPDPTQATLTLRLSRITDEDTSVRVQTGDDTAKAPGDYTAVDRRVTFEAGTDTQTVTVDVAADATDEPDESFNVVLTEPDGLAVDRSASVTVRDDDAPPALAITDVDIEEGDLGATKATFDLTLSAASGWTVSARAATQDGTAIAPDDYTALTQTLTWVPGETRKSVTVDVFGDTQPEPDEQFALAVDQLQHVIGPARAATATLRNDDTNGELPDTGITGGPEGLTRVAAPTFTFIGSVPRGRFECRTDATSWVPCTSPFRTRTLTDGDHVFAVRAFDGDLVDPEPATRAFTVDTQAPATTIVSGPKAVTADRAPAFELRTDDPDATIECRMDGAAWRTCGTAFKSEALADGKHELQARATDRAGNVDPTPAARAFRVDTEAPDTALEERSTSPGPAPQALMGSIGGGLTVGATGGVSVPLSCPAAATTACEGEVALDRELQAVTRSTAGTRTVTIVSEPYRLAAGETRTVAVALPDAARWIIERTGQMAAVMRVTARGGSPARRPVLLTADPAAPRILSAGLTLRVPRRTVAVRVLCPKTAGACRGTAVLRVPGRKAARVKVAGKPGKRVTAKLRLERPLRKRATVAATFAFKSKRVALTLTRGRTR